MRQTGFISIFLIVFLLLIGALAAVTFLFQSQRTLQRALDAQQADNRAAEATLVQVMAERQDEIEAQQASAATRQAEQARLQSQLAAQEAAVQTLEAQLVQRETTAAAEPAVAPAGTPVADAPPQVRIFLFDRNRTVRRLGEPVNIVASASHPDGIAALNVQVGEISLATDSPNDPFLHTVTTSWIPTEAGEYRITAIATTIQGRTSEPAAVTVTIVDSDDLTADILKRIERNVSDLRGLDPLSPVISRQVTQAELRERLEADFFADRSREDLQREVRALSAFDFVPADYDLSDSIISLYSEVVAGYYDPDTQELFVLDADGEMDAEEQLTHAHEFMHALQDQYFALSEISNELLSDDARLALRALGEGEAELIELLYESRGYLSGEELVAENDGVPTEFADVPDFLLSDFTFPYIKGAEFVYGLYNAGGFEAIGAAWESVPRSTEQILHPERYTSGDVPQTVALPSLDEALGETWARQKENVLGEFYLREYLLLQLERELTDRAATGWGGDRYAVYYRESDGALMLALRLAWDTAGDRDEFVAAFSQFAEARMRTGGTDQAGGTCWTSGEALCLYTLEEDALVVRAPGVDVATAVVRAIRNR